MNTKMYATGMVVVISVLVLLMTPNSVYSQQAARPIVTIDPNQLPLPVKSENAPNTPFQRLLSEVDGSTFDVPDDQRLTIETVSASCTLSAGDPDPYFSTYIFTEVGDNNVHHQILATFKAENNDFAFYTASATSVRIYADPGTTVSAFVGTGGSHCGVAISGYLSPVL